MGQEDVPIAFFSYCREDSEFALKLAADLKVAGAHVWIDQLDIEPGTPWDRAVEEALTHSPRMLVVLSPVSVNSDNVRDEVSFALSRQKRVIPVLYRDCEVPFRLARLQHIDFRPDYARALTILARALGVGAAAHAVSGGAVAAAAAESVVTHTEAEAEEQARQQKLAEERRLAEEQAQLEEARKYAEQSRLKKEREAAAEQAAHEQEQPQTEAEVRARQEQSRREQRAAEQARLEEEARLAAERVRLAQEEKERREAEIKARQEQLRREQQESVERAQLDLGRLEQEDRQREAAEKKAQQETLDEERRLAAEQERAERARRTAALPVAPQPQEKGQPAPPKMVEISAVAAVKRPQMPVAPRPDDGASPAVSRKTFYVAGTAILLIVIGIVAYSFSRGERSASGHTKQEEPASVTQTPQFPTPQTQAQQTQAPTGPQSNAAIPAAGGASAQPANTQPASAGETEPAKHQKLPIDGTPSQAGPKDAQSKKAPPTTNLTMKIGADNAVTLSPSAPASTSNRVRISQGVSHGMLMREVAPTYPPLARSARVQGQVVLDVVIGKDGAVKNITAESGHPMLIPAAINAVKQWRYQPYKLDGKPVEVDTQVMVKFTLTN